MQTPRPALASAHRAHVSPIPYRRTQPCLRDPVGPQGHLSHPASWPRTPPQRLRLPQLKTQKHQQFNLEKYFVSLQIYLKPRSGLTPVLGCGLVFYSENKSPGPWSNSPVITERTTHNTAFWGVRGELGKAFINDLLDKKEGGRKYHSG